MDPTVSPCQLSCAGGGDGAGPGRCGGADRPGQFASHPEPEGGGPAVLSGGAEGLPRVGAEEPGHVSAARGGDPEQPGVSAGAPEPDGGGPAVLSGGAEDLPRAGAEEPGH